MTRGRYPTPTAIRELEGNPQKRPMNDAEPKPDTSMPPKPKSLTGEARKAWEKLAPEMNRVGILTAIDGDGLESYCRLYAHARECWRKAKKDGPVVMIGGQPQPNPYISAAHKAEAMLHKLRSELGLNATSRTRIRVEKAQDEDDLEAFLKFAG